MRTTVTLGDDVAAALRTVMREPPTPACLVSADEDVGDLGGAQQHPHVTGTRAGGRP